MESDDVKYMQSALRLAAKGVFCASPNPRVGCVIVRDGREVGAGYHDYARQHHAEINALRQAGELAAGATAYVTLEPCAHFGRTPPCTKALIDAKIARVVIACNDCDPRVAGHGVAQLRAAGIAVTLDVLKREAQHLNRGFFKRITTNLPWVQLKIAATLDGKTALANGKSKWITAETSRNDVHWHRLAADAIIAGSSSILVDNALLTARHETTLAHEQPLRVIIDSQLRTPPDAKIFSATTPIIIATVANAASINYPSHCKLQVVASKNGKVDLRELLFYLGARGVNYVWIEGGQQLASAFFQQQLIDELFIYQAPLFFGASARDMLALPECAEPAAAPRWQITDSCKMGADWRFILQPMR